ncbi:response regulator transcription factor [Microbacterium marinilacus]|uniref:Response regulator transcription factor n=1 Tax=Microbacterium marinilacus TaxID=415209 RepID=A0ABP7BNV6_9MICO|nr:response regulator transcription factor [Microbacterium marinilacus]MBY0688816.1 response regulator transcription factor [Microbacterium marinilacus]
MHRVAIVGAWPSDENFAPPLQQLVGGSVRLSFRNSGERLHADVLLMNEEEFARYSTDDSERRTPVIVATREPRVCTNMLDRGASAVIALPIDTAELISAIYALIAPGRYLSRRVIAALLAQSDSDRQATHVLSEREVDVLTHLAAGLSDAQIADSLFLSPATVHTHILNLRHKLGARNRTHAVVLAIEHGIIAPFSPHT